MVAIGEQEQIVGHLTTRIYIVVLTLAQRGRIIADQMKYGLLFLLEIAISSILLLLLLLRYFERFKFAIERHVLITVLIIV